MRREGWWIVVCIGVAVAIGMLALLWSVPSVGGTCGLVPLKPLPPLGCRDLTPVCRCDASGQHCAWEWVCVPQ